MTILTTDQGRRPSSAERLHFEREGWVVVPSFVGESGVERLLAQVREHLHRPDDWGQYQIARDIAPNDDHLDEFLRTSPVAEFACSLIGPGAGFLADRAFSSGPKTPTTTHWHQDNALSNPPHDRPMCISWIALTDVPDTRAPLLVVPKSHIDPEPTFGEGLTHATYRFDHSVVVEDGEETFASARPLPVRAGDVIFFDGWLLHACRPNDDIRPRVALTARYRGLSRSAESCEPPTHD